MTTLGNLFAMIGSFAAPMIKKEKKTMIILCNILNIIGLAVQSLPINIYSLIIGKCIQGLACGAFTVYVPAFISEMAPAEMLGPLGGVNQAMCTFGILVPAVMTIPIPQEISSHQEDRSLTDDFLVS